MRTLRESENSIARIFAFGRKYRTAIVIVGAIISALWVLRQWSDYEPTPNANLELDGFVTYYLRPDLSGMSNDLKLMGIEEGNSNIVGMSDYEMLIGKLYNRGRRDAKNVEIKVPVEGTIIYSRVVGNDSRIERLSRESINLVPHKYASFGDLRVDDPPYSIGLWCSNATPLTEITFRYVEGDATKTVQYLAKAQPGGGRKLSKVVIWGMDSSDLSRVALKSLIVVLIMLLVSVVAFYMRRRFRGILVWVRGKLPVETGTTSRESPSGSNTNAMRPSHGKKARAKRKR